MADTTDDTELFDGLEEGEEEDSTLLDESKKKTDEKGAFANQWKIILSGIGVVVMVSLGVVIGATFGKKSNAGGIKHGHDASEKCAYDNIRLPNNAIPLKYRLFLHPNITDGKFGFKGDVRILIKIESETDFIVLHSKNLTIERTMLHVSNDLENIDNTPVVQTEVDKCKKHEQLIIKLGKKVPAGHMYVLHIEFDGTLATVLQGFYKSSYTTESGDKRYLATTHFEATGARTAFPCFDEPAMKATFKTIIVREKIHISLSNMPINKTSNRIDGLVADVYNESVKMSTYLVAFVVCDFVSLEDKTSRGIKVKVWAPKEQITQTKFALEVAPKILDYYEKFFKVEFPLPKLDLIAIPDFSAGAMENWGLITYRLTSILYDEKETSSSSKQWVAETIAHEFAHQWFGNLVTMKWWNDLWLNEGFASYVDFIGGSIAVPEFQFMEQFILRYVQRSLVSDSHLNSHPISVPVHDPAEIHELFDSISYSKGASIIRMMRDFIGADAFHTGLSDYLNKFKFSNAASNDLWACLSKASEGKVDVKGVMDTWTIQMGYPVINIARKSDNKELAFATQEHFITDVDTKDKPAESVFKYKWEVPLTYHFENDKAKQRKWFHYKEGSVNFTWSKESGWLKVNCDQIGYYRVNYDKDNWDALAAQLTADHTVLTDADRANLLDDVFELARAGRVTQVQALDMTTYLKDENSYVPYESAMSSLGYIGSMLRGRDGYKKYEKYLLQQVLPRVAELGWEDTGTHLNKYLRNSAVYSAVYHNDDKSVKTAKKKFNDWRFNNERIPPNLRSTIYLAGIKYGGKSEWDYMFNKYMNSPFPSEKSKLMISLARTSDPKILKDYLDMSLNDSVVKSQDSSSLIGAISGNPIGEDMAIAFVKKHWETIFHRYGTGSFSMSRIVKSTFGGLKTNEGLKMAEEFLKRDLGSAKLSGKKTIANIRNHIKWLEANEDTVVNWLTDHTSSDKKNLT